MQALASIQVDISGVAEGSQITVKFLGKPVFIRHRTADEIAAAKEVDPRNLPDPLARNPNIAADAAGVRREPGAARAGRTGW